MAIKIYGDKIVFPDNTEQTTASDSADTSYTKEEIDAQQNAQDVKIDKNTSDLTNVYTKTEVDDSQSDQDTEIAKKLSDAPDDGEQYVRKDGVWAELAAADGGITDAPADGKTYGRKDLKWEEVTSDAYTESETDALLDDKADKSTTYTKTEVDNSQDAQDNAIANNTIAIQTNTDAIAALPAPVDTYTKTEIDTQQNAQDVEIAKKANTADTYTKTQTDTLLDSKANVGDSYTKAETYNNTEIDSKLFEKADKTTTYTKDEVDASQDAQDVNISGNTSAIGALSGRVSANESDIATLQDGIFFSSSYSADYPDNPNRDPQTGNMYMQNISAFTYSYADTNQVFLSKTDEQGNVRQFTAVKPDDTIVLNQVESPNYGRYKVTSVNDLGTYVNLIVEFQIGEGTLLEGDTVALQAFPASAGGSGGIPEAPIDGKQYGRQDAEWTEVTGGGSTPTPEALVWEDKTSERAVDTVYTNTNDVPLYVQLYVNSPVGSLNYADFYIDGERVGASGGNANDGRIIYDNPLYIVPAGSTYELRKGGNPELSIWREARMPLAIAVGGASGGGDAQPPVVIRGTQNTPQTIPRNTWERVNFDNVLENPDNAFDGLTLTAKKEGFYQVNTGVAFNKNNEISALQIYKNGSVYRTGNKLRDDASDSNRAVLGSCLVHCMVGDKVEVKVYSSTATEGTLGNAYFDAYMISAITEGEVKEKEAIAFRGYLSSAQTGIPQTSYFKVNLDTASIDTDNAFVDGKFKPSVAGYYQVNGSLVQGCEPAATRCFPAIYKNGAIAIKGSDSSDSVVFGNNVSDIIYLNGTTDYIELYGNITASGTRGLQTGEDRTTLSAHLITGQSSGGSGGGETTDILPVLYSGSVGINGEVTNSSGGFIVGTPVDGKFVVAFEPHMPNNNYIVNISGVDYTRFITIVNKRTDSFEVNMYLKTDGSTLSSGSFDFTVTGTETIAVGGASSGGEAQPPVAFNANITTGQQYDSQTTNQLKYLSATVDTDSGLTDDSYIVPKDGLYSFSAGIYYAAPNGVKILTGAGTSLVLNGETVKTGYLQTLLDGTSSYTATVDQILDCKKGDVVSLNCWGRTQDETKYRAWEDRSWFSGHMVSSITEGSGGGDYTPEKMVWEDKLTEREWDTEYTNTNDVPLYVQIYLSSTGLNASGRFLIDGLKQGVSGNGVSTADKVSYMNPLYIIPAGSKYKLEKTGSVNCNEWKEARMPVAVGTGGKTVAFRGGISADQTVTSATWTKVNLDTASIDTDSAFSDGKFQPSVAGYYQVNGSVASGSTPPSNKTNASLWKNGDFYSTGTAVDTKDSGGISSTSNVSDVIYLNGTTDYIELYGNITSTGTAKIAKNYSITYLSAVLVSGGSGDSIWTEEDGKAVYDGQGMSVLVEGNEEMYIGKSDLRLGKNELIKLNSTRITMDLPEDSSGGKVVKVNGDGLLYKSTTSSYTTEEVDKKLAIKDKLIEKLSARLDALEKKVK